MNLAMIFAYLPASSACAESEFRAPDGSRLAILVCPHAMADMEPGEQGAPPPPEKRS
jgi:hypothetical protein